jgi:hypothetical protein
VNDITISRVIVQVLNGAGYLAYVTSNMDGLPIEQHVLETNAGKHYCLKLPQMSN